MQTILRGPNGPFILGRAPISIGKSTENQVLVSDASARQAEIRPTDQGYSIVDLGSGTGTFVNGQRLTPNEPMTLYHGDQIRVGNTMLTYEHDVSVTTAGTDTTPPHQHDTTRSTKKTEDYVPTTSKAPMSDQVPPEPKKPTREYVSANSRKTTPDYVPPRHVEPQKKSRAWIPIALVGGALAALLGLGGLFNQGGKNTATPPTPTVPSAANIPSPTAPSQPNRQVNVNTPTQMYQSYCNAVAAKDGNAAYGLYSTTMKQSVNATQATQSIADYTDCKVESVDDQTGKAVISYGLPNGVRVTQEVQGVKEGDSWKIASSQLRSTPSASLYKYCTALEQQNYNEAWDQYSTAMQQRLPLNQFSNGFVNSVDSCVIDKVNDANGTGTITKEYSNNSSDVRNEQLVQENGVWVIDQETAP